MAKIMENLLKIDDLGVPLFLETPRLFSVAIICLEKFLKANRTSIEERSFLQKKTPLVTASGRANFHAGRANVWEDETKGSEIQGDMAKDGEQEGSMPGTDGKNAGKITVGRLLFWARPLFKGYVSFRA